MDKKSVARLAIAFVKELQLELKDGELAEVVELNAREQDPNVCHTHDFIDANMAMSAAFTDVFQRDVNLSSDSDTELWNEAWSLAKRERFSIDALETRISAPQ